MQGVAVAVVDLAGAERAPDRGDLVAGGHHRHAQAAAHAHLGDAERGDEAELGGAAALAGGDRHPALGEVLAGVAQVLALLLTGGDEHAIVLAAGHFLHDDGVGALRDGGAGHDAHRLAGADHAGEGAAGEGGADHRERAFTLGAEVGGAHGVAVHRGVVVRGHVARRDHVLGEHAAERGAHGHALAPGDGGERAEDRRACGIDGEEAAVVAACGVGIHASGPSSMGDRAASLGTLTARRRSAGRSGTCSRRRRRRW